MASYKLVLLGDGRVGKTSIVSRFVRGEFDDAEASTVQAKMFVKKKVVVDAVPVEVAVWDTAGQERFRALGPLYYRNADGAVLVYDITDEDSFDRVKQWIKELKQTVGPDIALVICGNKCDLHKHRGVLEETAEAFAARQNALHFNTSAKLNVGVEEAFTELIRCIISRSGPRPGQRGPRDRDDLGLDGGLGAGLAGGRRARRGLRISDEPAPDAAAHDVPAHDAVVPAVPSPLDEAAADDGVVLPPPKAVAAVEHQKPVTLAPAGAPPPPKKKKGQCCSK